MVKGLQCYLTAISPISMPIQHLLSPTQITSQSENPNIYPAPKPHLLPHPGHYTSLQPLRSDHLQPERATPLLLTLMI